MNQLSNMKISILTPDFSNNCFARAWLLAKILQVHYDVEIIGPAFSEGIWKPLQTSCDFAIKMVKGYPNGRFELRKGLRSVSGDVVYASKPLMASFGVGLVKKIMNRKPLILDIDDWEIGFGQEFYGSLNWLKKINDFRMSISNLRSPHYSVILDRLTLLADHTTVSSKVLQAKYGGTVISHGRDVCCFDPQKFDRDELRKKYLHLENQKIFVVGFLGTPRPHKGVEDLVCAISFLRNEDVSLMILGMREDAYCRRLQYEIKRSELQDRVFFFPEQPFNKLPEFLSMVDLVVIPQREKAASFGQVPAKIFDAMSMAKPIIASRVSDIPEILNGCGWTVDPQNPQQLAEVMLYALSHPFESQRIGKKAREKCKQEYSWSTLSKRLANVFSEYEKH